MVVSRRPGPVVCSRGCYAAGRCCSDAATPRSAPWLGEAVEDSPLSSSSRGEPLKLSL